MKAIIFTYHTIINKVPRIGGIHYFIKYLVERKFSQIDIITTDYYLYAFLKPNDRVNFSVLSKLVTGYSTYKEDTLLRNSVLLTLKLPNFTYTNNSLLKKLYFYFYNKTLYKPAFISRKYDLCIVESGELLGHNLIIETINNAQFSIYRPSDPVLLWSNIPEFIEYEEKIMNTVDISLVINESSLKEYLRSFKVDKDIMVLYNPMNYDVIERTDMFINSPYKTKYNLFYYGAFKIDYKLIKYLARKNPNLNFYIAGPYKDKIKLPNVKFLGSLPESEIISYVKFSDAVFVPYKKIGSINNILEVTRKILLFMLFSKPIIAYNVSNELKKYGVFLGNNYEEINDLIIENLGNNIKYPLRELISKFSYNRFKSKLDKLFSLKT